MKPYSKNPRKLTEKQAADLRRYLAELGDLSGIVHDLNSDEIIGGNQRSKIFDINQCEVEIIQKLDTPDDQGTVAHGFVIWQGKRYAYRQVRWSQEQCGKANVVANRVGGEWDFELLTKFKLDDLYSWGFDKKELDAGKWGDLPADPGAQIDKAEELCEKWQVKIGDLWILGNHRLLCGDSTNISDVARLMGNDKWQLGFTSPPYNSGDADFTYDYTAKKEGGFYDGGKDDLSVDEYKKLCFGVLNNYMNFADSVHCLFWNVMYNANSRDTYGKIVFSDDNPFMVRETIVWNKIGGFPVAGTNILSRNSELIFLLSLNEKYLSNQTLRDCIYWNRWDISNSNSQQKDLKHKACFPVELPTKAIRDFSKNGHIVLDLFSGSGTTLIACERLERKCRGIEISPAYCAVAIQRWVDLTGKQPKLLP